jgi:hypothetical protein
MNIFEEILKKLIRREQLSRYLRSTADFNVRERPL